MYENVKSQFEKAAYVMGLDESVKKILSITNNEIVVHFPVKMDNGQVEVFTGYRVQHNNRYPSVAVSSGGDAACTTAGGVLGTGAVNTPAAFTDQLTGFSNQAGQTCSIAATGFIYGPYLRALPSEPVSNSAALAIVTAANAAEPNAAALGWRFNNVSGRFQANSNAAGRDARLLSAH